MDSALTTHNYYLERVRVRGRGRGRGAVVVLMVTNNFLLTSFYGLANIFI